MSSGRIAREITRAIAPTKNPGMGGFFLMSNRNKRCIVLDLKNEEGKKAYLKLAKGVDAIVCSVRPAAMARLGLGYEDCRRVNPEVVYMELVGFGQAGPYAKRPAYDDIIQGMSGMAAMQGGREGPPRFVNSSIWQNRSQFVVHATLAALSQATHWRRSTGQVPISIASVSTWSNIRPANGA